MLILKMRLQDEAQAFYRQTDRYYRVPTQLEMHLLLVRKNSKCNMNILKYANTRIVLLFSINGCTRTKSHFDCTTCLRTLAILSNVKKQGEK
jgi:hypothetical protein